MATELARHFRVYALDTPGYGLSDGLDSRPENLQPYLPLLAQALDRLRLPRVCLYGAATGAQIAIEFSKRYPERVALLVADTAGHIGAEECEEILRDYFPDVTPRLDGAHLATYWHMVRELNVFFPWSVPSAKHRIAGDLPPLSFMQQFLLEYLRAGTRYDWGYRAAFRNERAAAAQAVTVPALLPRWAGSIAVRITDALIDAGLPNNFTVLPLGGTMAERIHGIAAAVRARYGGDSAPTVVTAPSASVARWHSQFLDAAGLQLHARMYTAGSGRPCLALHGATESAAIAASRMQSQIGAQPVIAIDLPGFGETDPGLDDALSIESSASLVEAVVQSLGLSEVDLVADGFGACVAVEFARRQPQRVRAVRVHSPDWSRHPKFAEWLVRFAHDLQPRLDGAHLFAAWFFVRAQALWSPPFDHSRASIRPGEPALDANRLQIAVAELLKAGSRAARALQAEAHYPLAERLAELPLAIRPH